MNRFERDWKEDWVDRMGLIVALSGEERFTKLMEFKNAERILLTQQQRIELRECIRIRFTPTNGEDGCQSATAAVKEATS